MKKSKHRTAYLVSELRAGYFVVDITKADGSQHMVGGFATEQAATAFIKKQKQRPGWE
jgi:hypothetical protein